MRSLLFIALTLASVSLLFGQLDSNSITISASRSVYAQPDRVVFRIDVTSSLNASLDDIVAALEGSGIAAGSLSSVYTVTNYVQVGADRQNQLVTLLDWAFTLPVPFSTMKSTITSLTTLQKNITQSNADMTLTFNVQGTQVSAQLQASQPCAASDLVADARAQAQKLAAASGLGVRPILAISDRASGTQSLGAYLTIPSAGSRTSFPAVFTGPALTCSITVKFALP